jgi:hypothetical protein
MAKKVFPMQLEDTVTKIIYDGVHDNSPNGLNDNSIDQTYCNARAMAKGIIKIIKEAL